jgi:hypothetical protein
LNIFNDSIEHIQVLHESTAMAEVLVKKGMDPTHIYKEWGSYDTIGASRSLNPET